MALKGHYYKMHSIQNKKRQSSGGHQLHEVNLSINYDDPEELAENDVKIRCRHNSVNFSTREGDKDNSFLKIFDRKTLPWCLISLTLIGCMVSGLLVPAFAIVYSYVVQMFVLSRDLFKEKLILWNSVLMALALVSCFSYFISLLGSCLSTERMIQTARLDVFSSILKQQVSWFDNEEFTTLKLTDALARDPPQIKAVAGSRFGSLLTGSINLILAVGIAFYANWKLAGICCLVYPILIIVCYRQTSLRYINFAKQDIKIKAASKLASECIENIKTVQMLGLENILYKQYCSAMDSANKSGMRQSVLYALVYSISSSIIYLIYIVSFKYGALLLINNEIDLVHVLRVLFEVAFTAPIISIACNYTQDFVKGKQAVRNLVHIKSFKPALDYSSARIKQEIRGDIEFNRVTFCYPTRPDVTILKEFNLVIKAGQRVAIVGTSGCGKSTLISLLERFYNHQQGSILIDGVDINAWDVSYLRSKMGLVTQEPVLFSGTISDNIKYGCLYESERKLTHDEVVKAATMANIHQFILTLPQGYETLVGNKGCQLSGGQKQRIAIARALIRDPKILLLDEATSALDNHSEKLVQDALDKASKGRTTLVIAHRLSTVQSANFIAVIEDGRVVEIGTHQQLVAMQGRYYTMTKSQQIES